MISPLGNALDRYWTFVRLVANDKTPDTEILAAWDDLRTRSWSKGTPEDAIESFSWLLGSMVQGGELRVEVPTFFASSILLRLAKALRLQGRTSECTTALQHAKRLSHLGIDPADLRNLRALLGEPGASRRRRGALPTPSITREQALGWIGGKEIRERTALLAGPFREREHIGLLFVRKGAEPACFSPVGRRAFLVLREFFVTASGQNEAKVPVARTEASLRTGGLHPKSTASVRAAVSEANRVLRAAGLATIGMPSGGLRTLRTGVALRYLQA